MFTKKKGYRIERNIRIEFEKHKWRVIRAGGSLGEADLICVKKGKCIFLQIKSTTKKTLYYYGYMGKELEGVPFFIVVDFGYGQVRVLQPKHKVSVDDGVLLKDFLEKTNI
jgi:Holliday junction resolvase